MAIRIYRYQDKHYPCNLPIEEIWLEEDYPNGILTNTPDLTLYEYEVMFDKSNNLPPRHVPGEERNFVPYLAEVKYNDGTVRMFKRVKFERIYRLHYYESPSLEGFLFEHPDTEILYHRGYFFEKTWMD